MRAARGPAFPCNLDTCTVYIFMYVCMYVCISVCIFIFCIHMYICTYIYIATRLMCIYTYISLYRSLYLYIFISLHMRLVSIVFLFIATNRRNALEPYDDQFSNNHTTNSRMHTPMARTIFTSPFLCISNKGTPRVHGKQILRTCFIWSSPIQHHESRGLIVCPRMPQCAIQWCLYITLNSLSPPWLCRIIVCCEY